MGFQQRLTCTPNFFLAGEKQAEPRQLCTSCRIQVQTPHRGLAGIVRCQTSPCPTTVPIQMLGRADG